MVLTHTLSSFDDWSGRETRCLRRWPAARALEDLSDVGALTLAGNGLGGAMRDAPSLWRTLGGTLRRLDVSRCRLRSLEGVRLLPRLEQLVAQGNQLAHLPSAWPDLLSTLDASLSRASLLDICAKEKRTSRELRFCLFETRLG